MKNDLHLKGQLKWYLMWPVIMTVILFGVNLWIYTIDKSSGIIMSAFLLIYIIVVIFLYLLIIFLMLLLVLFLLLFLLFFLLIIKITLRIFFFVILEIILLN